MQENTKDFAEAADEASGASKSIENINSTLQNAVTISNSSAKNSNEIAKKMQDVIENMKEITAISIENAKSVKEIAAAEHLSDLTEELNLKLKLFKA